MGYAACVTAAIMHSMGPAIERRSLILRGVLDLCVLSLLQDRPVYGYEISQRLAEQGLTMAGGSTYPLLARLEKAGLVSTQMLPSESGPPRKYYSMTTGGRQALQEGRIEWRSVSTAISGLLDIDALTQSQEALG
jgi:PadR family transcriptional regulator PadR